MASAVVYFQSTCVQRGGSRLVLSLDSKVCFIQFCGVLVSFHITDDECTQDINAIASSISVTQASGLPDIPSDDSIMEAAMAEDNTNDTQDEARNFASGSVITIPSGESNPKKRQLLSKETESDFLEDHLVELLDAGNLLSVMYD